MVEAVFFLGNPGRQYRDTRHNLPWMLLDSIPFRESLVWQRRHKGEIANYSFQGRTVYLCKPLTLMNRSGECISAVTGFYKVPADRILIVHDDVELELGEIGFKIGGGAAGHKGLRSAVRHLGTMDFYRLRIGIGRPLHGGISSYVLGKVTKEENEVLLQVFREAGELLVHACSGDPEELPKMYRRHRVNQNRM